MAKLAAALVKWIKSNEPEIESSRERYMIDTAALSQTAQFAPA